MKNIYILIFYVIVESCAFDMFSSIEHLKHLHENEANLLTEYKSFLESVKEYSAKLEKKVKLIESEHKLFSRNIDEYVENPLNAFLLIKRLSYDIEVQEFKFDKIINNFHENIQNAALPISEFEGAIEGLLRLQKMYNLKSHDLADGIIENEKLRKKLTADDLIDLGKSLFETDPKFGQEYLVLALNRIKYANKLPKIAVLEELLKSYRKTNSYSAAVATIDEIIKINGENKELESEKMDLELSLLFDNGNSTNSTEEDMTGTHYTIAKSFKLISETCSGLRQQNSSITSKLYCFMESKNFYTKIGPFKVEIVNLDPYIVIFHDVISKTETDELKSISKIQLSRAEIYSTNLSQKVTNDRVAKLSWHYDAYNKIFLTLTNRVAYMTGLSMDTAEMWQIQNYGIGGHYSPHFDFFNHGNDFQINHGNRIATMLFYLSDVQKGGATVFPFLKLKVTPKHGMAVFWHNLNSSGNKDYLMLHTACPVLIGSKWVANKWLHESGQEFRRPCGLTEKLTDSDFMQKYYII